jgi:hypothetical protein
MCPQAEAGFLLWHHALQGPEQCEQLLGAGLLLACLPLLDLPGASPVERRCAAGARAAGPRLEPRWPPGPAAAAKVVAGAAGDVTCC